MDAYNKSASGRGSLADRAAAYGYSGGSRVRVISFKLPLIFVNDIISTCSIDNRCCKRCRLRMFKAWLTGGNVYVLQ